MLTYIFIGLALGSIYALAAASLVVTYRSAGILNFALGSMAFFVAKFFYWSHTTQEWSLPVAAVVSLLVVAPALGVVLYLGVFQFLRSKDTLTKIMASIGLSVALPALAVMFFGNETITQAAGLAPVPVQYWQVFGATLDLNQVIICGFLLVVVVAGTLTLRFTDVGLQVRAMVNSEALTSLSGTDPKKVALGVWAVSGVLAGSCGVLVGPTVGVSVESMTLLMASAFAAVVAARLRNLSTAVVVALLMGLVTDLSQYFLPENSTMTKNVVLSVPFVLMLGFLLFYLVRGDAVGQESTESSALDAAIRPEGGGRVAASAAKPTSSGRAAPWYSPRSLVGYLPIALILMLPLMVSGYWLGLVAGGLALAVMLLSFSLVTGDGGMIWLCQITFAGGGALLAAELWTHYAIDPMLAALIGGLAMAPVGVLIGVLTIRLGDLYVALVTLAFGLLVDTVIFSDTRFAPGMGGVDMARPAVASDDRSFAYFALAVLFVVGLAIINLRRSTTGLAINAIRWSEPAARTLGLSVVGLKLLLSATAAFVAGLGGSVLAMYNTSTDTYTFGTFSGLVLLAVLVTVGVRTLTAALIAGLSFFLLPAVFATYLPPTWLQVPALLFGLGAVALAFNPDGVVAMHARQIQGLLFDRGKDTMAITPMRGDAPPGAGTDLLPTEMFGPGDSVWPTPVTVAAGSDLQTGDRG